MKLYTQKKRRKKKVYVFNLQFNNVAFLETKTSTTDQTERQKLTQEIWDKGLVIIDQNNKTLEAPTSEPTEAPSVEEAKSTEAVSETQESSEPSQQPEESILAPVADPAPEKTSSQLTTLSCALDDQFLSFCVEKR